MDFGLAAIGQTLHGPNAPRLTRIGSILGTPLYMSPEQLCGQSVDPRADQFSFCVALYEALYGERPFAGDNFAELRAAVLEGEPRPAPLCEPRARAPARHPAARAVGRPAEALPRHGRAADALDQVVGAARGDWRRCWRRGRRGSADASGSPSASRGSCAGRSPPSNCASPPAKLDRRLADSADAARRAEIRAAFLAANVAATRASATIARASRWTPTPTPGRRCTARLRGRRRRRRRRADMVALRTALPGSARRRARRAGGRVRARRREDRPQGGRRDARRCRRSTRCADARR